MFIYSKIVSQSNCLKNITKVYASIFHKILGPLNYEFCNGLQFSGIHTSQTHYAPNNIRIGCASGFWGDSPSASAQLIKYGKLDFIIYDYLSEITMSLLTAAQAKRPEMGYAPDFVHYAIGPYLKIIKDKGLRIISNAGGINPHGCAEALKQVCKKSGVDLKIGVVSGDNLLQCKNEFVGIPDMTDKTPLPNSVHSMNAYLGSEPIVKCLDKGADIIITGRCADSSLALAPLVHSFGWKWTDYDLLASGSLAGHLIECGAQVTGGIFTDWELVADWDKIGFPIAEVSSTGTIRITKPPGTGGLINTGTVSEQLLYEIGDPRTYVLPDVICDFTGVQVTGIDEDVVEITGALGLPPTDSLKVCATYLDGYKATAVCCVGGAKSTLKGRRVAEALLKRSRTIFKALGMDDFTRTYIQVLGNEETYGPHAKEGNGPRDAVLWLSVHHKDKKALEVFAMEIASAGTGMAPGLTAVVGGRPKPSPLLRLHSFLVKKEKVKPVIKIGEVEERVSLDTSEHKTTEIYELDDQPISERTSELKKGNKTYLLSDIAYARSGDKGNSCNIGVIARRPSFLPYIQEALSKEVVARYFEHLYPQGINPIKCIKRYEVPGLNALNFVLEESLGGGGVASLRSDPQGKALAQMLLDFQIKNMPDISSL